MKLQEYHKFLQSQGISGDSIESKMRIVGDFVEFLTEYNLIEPITAAGKEAVEQYARKLIGEKRNSLEHFSTLCDYTDWLGLRRFYVALIEVMDCHNAMPVLAEKIEARHGRAERDRIFREAIPPLGADEKERCAHTRTITDRMAQRMAPDEMRAAWYQVQHGIPAENWRKRDTLDKEKFRQCENVDEFLNLKRRERDALLTSLHDEGKLWYTLEINDEVLDFIKRDPEIEVGRREGDRIFITKIPYNPIRYLHETDPRMKRYYACHCPLVREAIRQDRPIAADICDCSLGHASHYLAGLDQELRGEVLESVVKGDSRCRFVFYLSKEEP